MQLITAKVYTQETRFVNDVKLLFILSLTFFGKPNRNTNWLWIIKTAKAILNKKKNNVALLSLYTVYQIYKMITAKPQCHPQCSGVEYYTTPFLCTRHRVCQAKTFSNSNKLLLHKNGKAVLCKKERKKDESPYYIQLLPNHVKYM